MVANRKAPYQNALLKQDGLEIASNKPMSAESKAVSVQCYASRKGKYPVQQRWRSDYGF